MSVGAKYESLGFYAKDFVPYSLENEDELKNFKQRYSLVCFELQGALRG